MGKSERFAFSERYTTVVQELNYWFWRRYPQVRDAAERDNVLGLTLNRVADHEEKLGPAQNLRALIRRIFPEVAANLVRRSSHKVHSSSTEALEALPLKTAIDPRAGVENRILAEELLKMLDERSRQVVYRRFILGQDPSEIGFALGVTAGNVRVILSRALEQLRQVR